MPYHYVNCSGRTVLYICIEYCILVNKYYVSAQGVDECIIPVHSYSYYYYGVHTIGKHFHINLPSHCSTALVFITVVVIIVVALCSLLWL